MLKSIILLSLVLFASSCKDQTPPERVDERFSRRSPIVAVRKYTDEEFVVAKHICQALKNKREYFEGRVSRELRFHFLLKEKSCEDQEISTLGLVFADLFVSARGDLRLLARSPLGLNEEIITDQEGVLREVCRVALEDSNDQNDENLSNIETHGSIKLQFRFLPHKLPAANFHFEVGRFSEESDGIYRLSSFESLQVLPSIYGSKEGMLVERSSVINCSRGQKIYQQFLK